MYSFEQSDQLKFFLLSLGVGFALGVFYDILRALRLSVTNSKAATIIFDVLYFAVFGLVTFLFILAINKGQIRFYIIFGEIIGAAFYYFSFGIAAIKLTDIFVKAFRHFFALVFKILFAPLRLVFKIFKKCFLKISSFFKKTRKNSEKNQKKLLPKLRMYVYNLYGMFKKRKVSLNGGEKVMTGKKKKAKRNPVSIILTVAAVLVIGFFVVSIISQKFDNDRQSNEYEALTGELEQKLSENSELAAVVESDDEAALAEKYARENGYAYPDERLYYDATPGDQSRQKK